jgi:ribose/xylose/arabinose/galactoside ABC-type transport system permease subunit
MATIREIIRKISQYCKINKNDFFTELFLFLDSALIGGIVAGVVFLLVIVLLGAIVCRRYRNNRQYIGRLILDTDDDTDNVI